jgi:hypothetical protein
MNRIIIACLVLLLAGCDKGVVRPTVVAPPPVPPVGVPTTPVTPVPPVPIDLYILAGQSNCGRSQWPGTGDTGPVATDSEKVMYDSAISGFKIYNAAYALHSISDLRAGVNTMLLNYNSTAEMGMEVSFFAALKNSGAHSACIMKMGYGSTDLANWWKTTGEAHLFEYTAEAINLLKKQGKIPVLKAFIWMQGESDATTAAWASAYGQNLGSFFNDFDAFYNNEIQADTLPVPLSYKKIIGRINGITDPTEIYRDTVRLAQENYCADPNNNAILINTDNYPLFGVHYTLAGQIQFGLDVFNSLK